MLINKVSTIFENLWDFKLRFEGVKKQPETKNPPQRKWNYIEPIWEEEDDSEAYWNDLEEEDIKINHVETHRSTVIIEDIEEDPNPTNRKITF